MSRFFPITQTEKGFVCRSRALLQLVIGAALCWTSVTVCLGATGAAPDAQFAGNSNSQSQAIQNLVPPLPRGKAPVEFFRELLAVDAQHREKMLTNRPPESRKLILAKVQEYEALSPEQRELRLRVTELRYYLLPLMSAPASGRTPIMERVPTELRSLVEQRLRRWDELPPEKQKDLLDNENWIRQVAEFTSSTPTQQRQVLTNMPASQRLSLETAVGKWQALGESRREEIAERFEEYFGLRPHERAKILLGFSEPERRQMEKTLQAFDKLNPVKRAECVRALDKLAQLTPKQRDEFLVNAERWQSLSSTERKAWRDLVFNLSMPPKPPVPPPPVPPSPREVRPPGGTATTVMTN